jgi:NitT/TauT family transport system ATP-binding protein
MANHGNELDYRDVAMRFVSGGSVVSALESFSCKVSPSQFLAIIGPSGCGKSTLINITSGLVQPSSGEVRVGGQPVQGPGPDKAVVFQNFSLFPWKTVRENIDFGLRINGKSLTERRELIDHYIRLIDLVGFENHYPRQLSGGMQQRVAIARSLVMRPRVLLMDEPFGALDAMNRTLMQEELVRVWQELKPTVLFITHSVEEAVYLADRVLVMTRRPGRIKEIIDIDPGVGLPHWRNEPIDVVQLRPRFQELRHHLWNQVRNEIHRSP